MNATIVFDGVCGVCNAYVQFVIRRDPEGYFSFVSAQSMQGQQLRKTAGDIPADSIVLIEGNITYVKSEAILRIGRRLTPPGAGSGGSDGFRAPRSILSMINLPGIGTDLVARQAVGACHLTNKIVY